ncbi:hypothetical protein OC834_006169 [Tilletia horrida]|uniref:Uncharacterized protein n=1 Tax=Tilletia horrida TaxID=155126 RepID=A0AAN6G5K8_9BASI|nr:hypothetical protein OC842_008006 [Tilletia horrida]KAK0522727.1 hypothetical protein OC834_006169 [Tilletia horrida]KAK0541611.1 hypothetical protein OC844_008039 [Tilletia horrida]
MALPRPSAFASALRALAPRPSPQAKPAAAAVTRAFSSSQPAQGSSPGAHQEEAHEEYPREDFSSPFFRNVVVFGIAIGVVYKVSNIHEGLHASRASSSGKSSFQDAEHAEKAKPWLTRYIEHHTTPTSVYKEANAQWLEAAQKTAETKLLLQDAERPPVVRLRHIGSFEAGSPFGILPGSQVDLSDLKIKKDGE